jgi:hypothetical protein
MKNFMILMLCLGFSGITAQEAEVQKAIETFFIGFHAQDTIKMKSVIADQMVLHSVAESPAGNKLSVENAAEFVKSIASIPKTVKFEEKLLSYKILIDGSMAHAWTPYEFYVNGKLSHKGVNSFQLFKDGGIWKIVYIIDTRRK